MSRRTAGMIVVVTGASAGIGRALSEQLAAAGATLALAARREERLRALNERLGGGHLCVPTDVADPAHCARLIARTLERYGRIDTLVCNAGYGLIRPVGDTTGAELLDLFRTNVLGTTACVNAALPHLLAQPHRDGWRGQVVVVASAASRRGLPDLGAYTATKAAQVSLAESLRVELRGSGVAVTTVHPVTTDTEFFREAIRRSRVRPPERGRVEVLQSPADVAAAIASAIRRPRPEVWPHLPSRLLLTLGAFAPRVVDWVLSNRRRRAWGRRNRVVRPAACDAGAVTSSA